MKLVIAEKPSVAISIAKVIGATKKKDGFYEGNGFRVSWCVGHLIQMANPDAYDEKYAKWNLADLPIIPSDYKYEVAKSTKKQFTTLKKLMNDKEIDTVINACDAGREGESIFRLVYNEAKCKKKMQRLWISSMEEEAIKEGFSCLKEGTNYDNLFKAAQARSIADWLVGMNLSRLYSSLYKQNYSIGRVQTPTLAMIVARDYEIDNFKKEKYFTVNLSLKEGFALVSERIDDEALAKNICDNLSSSIEVTDVEKKEKITRPDLPFDLTTLQRECNKYFGYSAKQTLDYAQSLYEKKLITYPRTDSRCLTEDMIESTVNNILGKNDFDTERIKTVFNSKKVTDHHAIIPTVSSLTANFSEINESEAKVYKLISDKLHSSFGYPLVESTTKIIAKFDNIEFTATGKSITDEGFTKFIKDYTSKKAEEVLPVVSSHDVLNIENKEIKEKFTQPPKHFTEDTLLKSMENAGSDVLEKGIEVERQGIGTPATRAGIIENLIYRGFVERDKKNLLATHKGISLVTIVSDTFKSPETTAEWEMQLSHIAQGNASKEDFLKGIEKEIREIILKYKEV